MTDSAVQKRPASSEPEYDRNAEPEEHGDAHTHERAKVDMQAAPDKKNVNARAVLVGAGVVAAIAAIWFIAIFLSV